VEEGEWLALTSHAEKLRNYGCSKEERATLHLSGGGHKTDLIFSNYKFSNKS